MTGTADKAGFFTDAHRVVTPLRDALRELMGADGAGRSTELPLNPTLRSRVTRGIETDHLASTLYHLPGSDGLRRLVRAAKKAGASPDIVARCNRCIEDYEEFLRSEGVSRDSLHAMVGDLSPEARSSVVRTNAQAVHKAMCNLIGLSAEVMLTTLIVLPGDEPGRCHLAQVRGFAQLQRLRLGAWFLTSGYGRTGGDAVAARTLDDEPIDPEQPSTLLRSYCSDPPPHFAMTYNGRQQMYQLVEHEVGLRSSTTFFFGEKLPDALPNPMERPAGRADASKRTMLSSIAVTPSKRLQFDVFIHRDIWPDAAVHLDTFRTVPIGPVDEDALEERKADRIDLGMNLQSFDGGGGMVGASKAPRYGSMIDQALQRLGVHRSDFRVHRCETVYPLYGTQYAMRFESA